MIETKPFQLLSKKDSPALTVVNPAGRAPICLVCEHASANIPRSLDELGLSADDRYSHAVWDIGAENLARRLCEILDAPLVLGGVSRLVYDCNRPPERADAMPFRTEKIVIPGNRDISEIQRSARVREVYDVFHAAVSAQIDSFSDHPVLVTVHSFTPLWHGERRTVEIGLLHDADPTLAQCMQGAAEGEYRVELNVPYSAVDGVTHTLARHGTARGLQNVMIEVRNDLLNTADETKNVAHALQQMLHIALSHKAHIE